MIAKAAEEFKCTPMAGALGLKRCVATEERCDAAPVRAGCGPVYVNREVLGGLTRASLATMNRSAARVAYDASYGQASAERLCILWHVPRAHDASANSCGLYGSISGGP